MCAVGDVLRGAVLFDSVADSFCARVPFRRVVLTVTGYIVIGGQHSVEALKKRRAELLREHRDLPEEFNSVLATVLAHSTPIGIRL